MAKAKPALKKSDLLGALKDKKGLNRTDLTKDSLQADLAKSFAFIPQFFDYLFALYESNGKFETAEDGTLTIKEVGQIRSEPRTIYQVAVELNVPNGDTDEEGNIMVEDVVSMETGTLMPGDKLEEGWSLSKNSAAKIATKMAYADYKASKEAFEEWAANVTDEDEADEAEAA